MCFYVYTCRENEALPAHAAKKAQYCLLAHSNQTELLPAQWDLFRSSRLALHHWQQVQKQQSQSQDELQGARFYFFFFLIMFAGYSHHWRLNVFHVVKWKRRANRAEKKYSSGVIVILEASQRECQAQNMCQPHREFPSPPYKIRSLALTPGQTGECTSMSDAKMFYWLRQTLVIRHVWRRER